MPDPSAARLVPPSWRVLVRRLALVSIGCAFLLTVVRLGTAWGMLSEAALLYDLRYDPFVIEAGELRSEGPRRPGSPDTPLYVDPDDTLDLTTLPPTAVVLRKTEALQVQGNQTQRYAYTELQEVFQFESLRVDSASLSSFQARYGAPFLLALGLVTGGVELLFSVLSLVPIIGLAGLLAARIAPTSLGTARWWAKHAAANAWFLPPLWTVAALLGFGGNPCFNVLVYPWLLTTVTVARLRVRPPAE